MKRSLYFICYQIEKKINKNDYLNIFYDIFILILKINKIYLEKNKRKFSILSLNTKKKKSFTKSPIYKFLNNEKLNKIFNLEYINKLLTLNEEDFRLQIENIFVNLITKNFQCSKFLYNFEYFLNKIQKRKEFNFQFILKNNVKDNLFYDMKYYKILINLANLVQNNLKNYKEKILIINEKNYLKSIEYKKIYIKNKKQLFNKNNFWYFETNNEIKYKILNHYGNILYPPLLIPILDINNYIPDFNNFDNKSLFLNPNKINSFLNLNINSILPPYDIYIDKNNNIENKNNELINKNYNFFETIYKSNFLENFILQNEISNVFLNSKFDIDNSIILNSGFSCCLVKKAYHISGYINIYKNSLIFNYLKNKKYFEDDFDDERKTCFGSYFDYKTLKLNKEFYIKIKITNIKYIFTRKYYFKDSAIEIFTKENKSYFFNFENNLIREKIINDLFLNYGKILKKNDILINKQNKDFLHNKIELWTNLKISNFELLIWLNHLANRSFNDISQYPVFPWIINFNDKSNNYNDKIFYRNLSLPMGMIVINEKGKKRKDLYLEKFSTLKSEFKKQISSEEKSLSPTSNRLFLYGSHYSNPVYVTHYLARIFPFTYIMIEIQGNKFDDPNRLFLNIEISYENCISNENDLREIIPEFFYLPQMYENINLLKLNIKENKSNNVILPECFNQDFNYFVYKLNIILENEKISKNLNYWIDLIFGFENSGKNAENKLNLFIPESYENFYIDNITNKEDKLYFLRIFEFGKTPHKLLNKGFPIKKIKNDFKDIIESQINKDLKVIRFHINMNVDNIYVIKLFILDKDLILIIFNNFQYKLYEFQNEYIQQYHKQFYVNKENLEKYLILKDNYINENFPIKIYKKRFIIQTGFINGIILIVEVNFYENSKKLYKNILNSYELKNNYDPSEVILINICKDFNDEIIIFGTEYGSILIYNSSFENILSFNYSNKIEPISNIDFNNNLQIIGFTTKKGLIKIFTYPTLINIYSDNLYCNIKFFYLFDNPLNGFVIYNNQEFITYNIKGDIIKKINFEFNNVKNPFIIKNKLFQNYLIFLSKGNLIFLDLPFFENNYLSLNLNLNEFDINLLEITEDKKTIYIWSEENQDIIIIKDPKIITETDKILLWHMSNDFS